MQNIKENGKNKKIFLIIGIALYFVLLVFMYILLDEALMMKNVSADGTGMWVIKLSPFLIAFIEGLRRFALAVGAFFIACAIERLNLARGTDFRTTVAYTARDWFIPIVFSFNILFCGSVYYTDQSIAHFIITAIIIAVAGQILVYSRSEKDGSLLFGRICGFAAMIGVWALCVISPIIKDFNQTESQAFGLGNTTVLANFRFINRDLARYSNAVDMSASNMLSQATDLQKSLFNISCLAIRFVIPTIITIILLRVIITRYGEFSKENYSSHGDKVKKK